MSSTGSAKLINWLLFLISLTGMILFLMFLNEFFWVMLPLVLTFLVKALDAM